MFQNLRPVYALQFVDTLCQPDIIGARISYVYLTPGCGTLVTTKIGDFSQVGPTLSEKPAC